ncbi:MAG: Ig-like domain-containing protein [bacterium]|nr:Ig-like domain-containing protein [bacterium]
MRKLMAVIICTILVFSGVVVPSEAAALDGAGTELNPYMITNEAQLRMISDFPDAYWRLASDIVLTDNWAAVGTTGDDFTGTLDGNGYKITGFNVTVSYGQDSKEGGFIEYNYGTIKNLRLEGSVTTARPSGGFLVFSNHGTIENCSTAGTLTNENTRWTNADVGGMACYNNGVIKNCYSRVKMIRNKYVSGGTNDLTEMAGFVSTNQGTIINCYAACEMSWPYSIGASYIPHGFVGYADTKNGGSAEGCYYDKELSGCSDSTMANGRSTVAMKMQAGYANWDFKDIWTMDENVNDGYPYLQVERSVARKVTGLSIDRTTASVAEGGTIVLAPVFVPANATNKNVTWSTSSRYVATVDENGVVTGISEGTAVITAVSEDGGYTASCVVTVTKTPAVIDDYTVNSLKAEEQQNGRFHVWANITKNSGREDVDTIMIVLYDSEGVMMDYIFMEAQFAQGQTANFGGVLKADGDIMIKAFVWDSLDSMIPLSNTIQQYF